MSDDWKDKLASISGHQTNKNVTNDSRTEKDKIIHFYSGDAIKGELVDSEAKNWALSFMNPEQPTDRRLMNPRLTSAQLRKFHNDIRELEAKVFSNGAAKFARMLPLVKMVKSKVAYACPSNGRDRKVPVEFRNYMELMINSIENYKDFKAFSLCFEAVVGYFYGEGGR